MKKRYYFITGAIAYVVLLLTTFPAQPIIQLINDNSPVNITGVTGSLWNAKAQRIQYKRTIRLDESEWSFKPWQLLTGRIAVDLNTQYKQQKIKTEVGMSFLGTLFINDLTVNTTAQKIAQLANIPLVQLTGTVSIDIDHAQWQQGEPPLASGLITWNKANVIVAEAASLGDVSITLGESEKQLLNATIKNTGGDIAINGNAELLPELKYATNIKLKPTQSANNNIKQSLGMFAKKQNNGEYLLDYSGSLNQIGF